MTHALLALTLLVTSLPPEAARHSERAGAHYDAGRLDAAIDEFAAAYAALPDPRGDLDDREQMLGSLHGLLLQQHAASGAAQPLCRLQALLGDHLAALRAAYPAEPGLRELGINQERLDRLAPLLAGLPRDACPTTAPPANASTAPPGPPATPASTSAAPPGRPATPASASAAPFGRSATPRSAAPGETSGPPPSAPATAGSSTSTPLHADGPPPARRGLRIGGFIALAVSAGLLGVMGYGIARERRRARDADAVDRGIEDGSITPAEYARLLDARADARAHRLLAIGTGAAALAGAAVGVTLLALARRTRTRRVALAPWWLSSGAGLTLALPLP